jgi:hypothetical protein
MARIRWSVALVVTVVLAGLVAAASGAVSAASNRVAAHVAVGRLLADFTPPAGAVRVESDPDPAALGYVGLDEATPNLITIHAFWTLPASVSTVVSEVRADPPPGTTLDGGGSGSDGGTTLDYSRGAVTRVLSQQYVVVSIAPLSATMSAIRVDGEAVWITPRSPSEMIPSGARMLAVMVDSGLPEPHAPTRVRTFTVTSLERIRSVERIINALPAAQPGEEACPSDNGSGIVLRFRSARGTTLALADVATSGCGGVGLMIRGRTEPSLASQGFFGSGLPLTYSLSGTLSRALGRRLSP